MTIVVAGHTGLVGSAIFEALQARGEDVIGINSKVVNLLNREATFQFIKDKKPDLIIDSAAIVGGIGANNEFRVEFLSKNLQIQSNLMDAAHEADVERFVFLGSSCIYPRECPQPIKEEYLMTGPLESTNSAYAVAKIAGIELIKSYRKQYSRRWISLMPTNMYGPNDNFDLESSHVLPALMRKFHEAKINGTGFIEVWGTGSARREFLHADDLADACLFMLKDYHDLEHINIGTGIEVSIKELAETLREVIYPEAELRWDTSKPDGAPRKLLDVTKIEAAGWTHSISLRDGIESTYKWFMDHYEHVRGR